MKLQGNVTVQNHLKGTISKEEIVAFIRQTVAIPDNAAIELRPLPEDEDGIEGVNFEAIWHSSQRGDEQNLPAKVMTTVPPATIQHEPG